ncbi:MAG: CRISPR-associated protein Cas4 [Methanobacteriaceae archaeon]
MDDIRITGVMVQYYISCKRELWFFYNQINMNYDNENIEIGRIIHDRSFSRESKNINLGETSFDFIKKGEKTTIFEIKKSSKLEEPVRWQLYYYLWNVKKAGIDAEGVLVYPEERKREKIVLDDDVERKIVFIMDDINKIVLDVKPPKAQTKPYCKGCTYYELCFI